MNNEREKLTATLLRERVETMLKTIENMACDAEGIACEDPAWAAAALRSFGDCLGIVRGSAARLVAVCDQMAAVL